MTSVPVYLINAREGDACSDSDAVREFLAHV